MLGTCALVNILTLKPIVETDLEPFPAQTFKGAWSVHALVRAASVIQLAFINVQAGRRVLRVSGETLATAADVPSRSVDAELLAAAVVLRVALVVVDAVSVVGRVFPVAVFAVTLERAFSVPAVMQATAVPCQTLIGVCAGVVAN